MKSNEPWVITLLANFLIPLAGISTDIYLPSLPHIMQDFGTLKATVQLTVTAFAAGMGLTQFIAGPISDAWGRKPLIVGSLILQILCIALILMTDSIHAIIAARLLQGIAAAFLIVPTRALLNDHFEGIALKKQLNYITISFAMGPIVAPFIGGYLQHYFHWQSCFIFILVYALIGLFLAIFVYRESIHQKQSFSRNALMNNLKILTQHRYFIIACLFASLLLSGSALFQVTAPFLVQKQMGYSALTFGHMSLLIGLGWFLGNLTNRLLFTLSNKVKARAALLTALTTLLILVIFSQLGITTLASFMLPMCILSYCYGIIFSIYTADCLTLFKHLAASANGFYFGVIWCFFSFFTFLGTLLKGHGFSGMAFALLIINLFGICIYWVHQKQTQ